MNAKRLNLNFQAISTNFEPSPRVMHTAVWTGNAMLVWGGLLRHKTNSRVTGGGLYFPDDNHWQTIRLPSRMPLTRYNHSHVWTGDELIVWGGIDGNLGSPTAEGFRFNKGTRMWSNISDQGAPAARSGHSSNWDGERMFVFAGLSDHDYLADLYAYQPDDNRWSKISLPQQVQKRSYHTSVWTGSHILVWGGQNESGFLSTGLIIDPYTGAVSPMNLAGAPKARINHTAVWTGRKMIIWGGLSSEGEKYRSGAMFDPASNRWQAMSLKNSPARRDLHSAVWTGTHMIIWGGSGKKRPLRFGAAFNPEVNRWIKLRTEKPLPRRLMHSSVLVGNRLILWGGASSDLLNAQVSPPGGSTLWLDPSLMGPGFKEPADHVTKLRSLSH
ncbi:Kelch repeat-containing protein [Pseudobacteriovorax antillogorgiicola]|uniref:Kelch repeat-containing protein n=1 Tax=Pseudobacteriovorax antillogorgiicola TaxID=1513793 RepID=UPI001A9FC295|nr:kelch repeat-containing protein [Pseudobacteriovorax antillogorgiicola]